MKFNSILVLSAALLVSSTALGAPNELHSLPATNGPSTLQVSKEVAPLQSQHVDGEKCTISQRLHMFAHQLKQGAYHFIRFVTEEGTEAISKLSNAIGTPLLYPLVVCSMKFALSAGHVTFMEALALLASAPIALIGAPFMIAGNFLDYLNYEFHRTFTDAEKRAFGGMLSKRLESMFKAGDGKPVHEAIHVVGEAMKANLVDVIRHAVDDFVEEYGNGWELGSEYMYEVVESMLAQIDDPLRKVVSNAIESELKELKKTEAHTS